MVAIPCMAVVQGHIIGVMPARLKPRSCRHPTCLSEKQHGLLCGGRGSHPRSTADRLAWLCGRAQIGELISRAMERVGRQGVVTMEESRTAEDNLYVVEGMQFDRGYISPYFVTDPERMVRPRSCSGMPGRRALPGQRAGCMCVTGTQSAPANILLVTLWALHQTKSFGKCDCLVYQYVLRQGMHCGNVGRL